jgi:hypothetical protein
MNHVLSKGEVGKILRIDTAGVITIPSGVFSQGDVIVMFNNTDKSSTIHSLVDHTYRGAFRQPRLFIEFPPRGLANILFVDDTIVVISGDAI